MKLSKNEYYKIRNTIYEKLILNTELKDTDNNFILFDDILGDVLNVSWND